MSGYAHIEIETDAPNSGKRVGEDKRYVLDSLEKLKELKGVKAIETQYVQVFGEGVTTGDQIEHNLKVVRTRMAVERDAHHVDNR